MEAEILSTWLEPENKSKISYDEEEEKDEQEYDTHRMDSDDVTHIDMDKYNNAVLAEGRIFNDGQSRDVSVVYKPNDANRIILY